MAKANAGIWCFGSEAYGSRLMTHRLKASASQKPVVTLQQLYCLKSPGSEEKAIAWRSCGSSDLARDREII